MNDHNHEDSDHRNESCPVCALIDATERTAGRPAVTGEPPAPSFGAPDVEATIERPDDLPTAGRPAVGTVGLIPIAEILDDPADNVARGCEPIGDTAKLRRFAASLRSGQRQPIRVRPINDPTGSHRYRLTFGFRRLAAARLLGWKEIEAKVVAETDEQAALSNWAEGNREDANPYEHAIGAARASQRGVTPQQIAEQLGVSVDAVESLIAIATKCPPELLEIFRVDSSKKTLNLLEVIASIDAGSPEDTRRIQLDTWSDERTKELQRQREMIPKPKPTKTRRHGEPMTLGVHAVNRLNTEIESSTEWYDPIGNEFRLLSDEMRSFARALIRSFKKGGPIGLR